MLSKGSHLEGILLAKTKRTMDLCDDIMWIIGQYVETYRNNKKIKKKFTIFQRPTIIENDTQDEYGDKTYKEICDMHKFTYYNIKFRSGKNNGITKQDRINEMVYDKLYKYAYDKTKQLERDSIYHERSNYENLMSGQKLYLQCGPSTQFTRNCDIGYQNAKIRYLKDSMTQQEQELLQNLETMLRDVAYTHCEYLMSDLIRNKIKIIDRIGTKYNIHAWENAWTRIIRNEPQGLKARFHFDERLRISCVIKAQ